MTSFLRSDRSRAVAVWLLVVAALVLAMVVVGGATRLTDSGLSITQWKPVTGALPPMNLADWQAEFDRYRDIPQYKLVNPNMDLYYHFQSDELNAASVTCRLREAMGLAATEWLMPTLAAPLPDPGSR